MFINATTRQQISIYSTSPYWYLLACTPTFGKVGVQIFFRSLYPHLKIRGAAPETCSEWIKMMMMVIIKQQLFQQNSTCWQYSRAMRFAHSTQRLTGRAGFDTSAHFIIIRLIRVRFSGSDSRAVIADWRSAPLSDPVPLSACKKYQSDDYISLVV